MTERKETIDALAGLMSEFGLTEAYLRTGDVSVRFKVASVATAEGNHLESKAPVSAVPPAPEPQPGTPIASPMNGIFYNAPSPSSSPFVLEGDTVSAGQVVGLIEAMKVFNEITATVSGTVLKIVAESGQVVQPGDTLLLIG